MVAAEALGPTAAYATERHVTGPYRFVVLEGVGHWIPEMAAERFNQELLAHLALHPSPAGSPIGGSLTVGLRTGRR